MKELSRFCARYSFIVSEGIGHDLQASISVSTEHGLTTNA
jgi:hypothetical protein